MCGICGQVRYDGTRVDTAVVERMRDSISHRGPDDNGLWHQNVEGCSAALAHTRLSIIDPSPAGHQPMCDRSGRYWIVYNGEVYNYRELREELSRNGHCFSSQTDTEVVLAAYAEYGNGCVERFNGMFALAVWDTAERTLFCARDRLGIKPFYYALREGRFSFASEVKSLLECSDTPVRPNNAAVYDYVSLGLMHHGTATFFDGIEQLEPGNILEFTKQGLNTRRYWVLSDTKPHADSSFDAEELRTLLNDSVTLRLRSDVPLGVLLSGGLDSSAITSLAARNLDSPLQTFSLDFDDPATNESAYAQQVAHHCGADSHLLRPEGTGLWEELGALIRAQDSPTHAPEVYSSWCMMRAVSKCGVKVLLSGEGGDELLGGYNWYPKYLLASFLRSAQVGNLARELRRLPENFSNPNTSSPIHLLLLLVHSLLPYAVKRALKPELRGMRQVLKPAAFRTYCARNSKNIALLDPLDLERKMHNDMIACTLPQYLRYEDANSMAFGIEERVPFLDHRLVEWANRLSVAYRIRDGWNKHPLRQAIRPYLPESVVNRRDKKGLSAPHETWFRSQLRGLIESLFNEDCAVYEAWIDRGKFLTQLQTYMNGGRTPVSRIIWRLINLEMWLRAYAPTL